MPVIQDQPINFDQMIEQEFAVPADQPAIREAQDGAVDFDQIIEPEMAIPEEQNFDQGEQPINFDTDEGFWDGSDDEHVQQIPVPIAEPTYEPELGK